MKQFSIFHVPVWSFFSKDLYLDACFRWKGTGFGYLFLLLAVLWIAPIAGLQMGLSDFVATEAPKVVTQIPVISIVDGKASIAEPQPYYIKNPDTGANLAVIDTTGTIASPDDGKALVLITQKQAIFKKSEVETRAFSFQNVSRFTLSQEKITYWLNKTRSYLAPILYGLAVIFSFMYRVIQALMYAALGMIFVAWCRSERTYQQLLRLSVVAVTPAIIIKTIISMIDVTIPFSGLLYLAIALGYLFLGVQAAAQFDHRPPAASVPAPTDGAAG